MSWKTSFGHAWLWPGRTAQSTDENMTPEIDPAVLADDMANFQTPSKAIVPYDGYSDDDADESTRNDRA